MKKLLVIIAGITLLLPQLALADFVPSDEDENASNTIILDADDTGGNVTLQFGASLGKYLRWNSSTLNFDLSDDLTIDGGFSQNGLNITLDADNAGAGNTVNIIANQGSDNDGTIRYNATTNEWEYSNDGGAFTTFGSGGSSGTAEYFDAYDSTGGTSIDAGFTDIPLGTERKKTTDFTHSTGSAEITVNTDGTYYVNYAVTTDITSGTNRSESEARLMLDTGSGYAAVAGSIAKMYNRTATQGDATASRSFTLDLSAGDKLKIQAQRSSGSSNIATLAGGSALVISRVEGGGGGEGNHTQNTDIGTDSNTFILDNDDTGGNVTLQFGTALAETLFWDSSNSRFTLTDALRAEGNLAVIGQAYVADDHAATDSDGTLSLGRNSNTWENLTWNDTNDQFQISDDLSFGQNQIRDVALHNASSAPGSPVAGQIYHNTSDNNTYIWSGSVWEDITASGGGGSSDFEGVYTTDVDKTLTTGNGAFTINTGTNDFIVASNDWSIDASGNIGIGIASATAPIDIERTGAVMEIGNGNAALSYITFDDGTDHLFGWDSSNAAFGFTDNIFTNGTIITLDYDNTGPGANVGIIVNQGSDNNGIIGYDAASNQWVLSNDGGAFEAIATGVPVIDYGTTANTAGNSVTTAFNKTFTSPPVVVVTPNSSDTIGNNDTWYHISNTTTTQFTITVDSSNNGESFNWIAIGT
ncbi:hypothetical protein JXD20_04725 [Candidatus Peregrinibacteria bacterium]|nr:hypothetical protein [Candidatus Peregrinibacteria bacterium]